MKVHNKPTCLSQFFRDAGNRISVKVFKKIKTPWMTAKELDIITEVLGRVKPERTFEWGSGFSTLMLPGLLPDLKLWHSLEHDRKWHEFIVKENKDPRVTISLVEPDDPDYSKRTGKYDERKEGIYDDFKTYIEFAAGLGGKFDFIFIDGRARKECLKQAYNLVSDRGVVIVHDANRDAYFSDLPPFHSTLHLQDYRRYRKAGGIWVGRKSGDLSEVLDVERHRKLWRQHEILAKILFLR